LIKKKDFFQLYFSQFFATKTLDADSLKILDPDSSVADPDPGSGAFLTPWIRDPGWVKSKDLDPGTGMNNPDHIFLKYFLGDFFPFVRTSYS
jgi:hypothetical protein